MTSTRTRRTATWRVRLLAAGAAALSACGAEGGGDAAPAPSEPPVRTSSGEPEDDGADEGAVELGASCTNPAGFVAQHPADWTVNPGEVVPACSRFAPGEMVLREGTDVRVAAIRLSVEPVAFDRVTGRRADEQGRAVLAVDGRDAVRIERVTRDGLYPIGTSLTSYAIRLEDGEDGPRTLVADTVGLPGLDYERNVDVLDAMVRALDLDPTA